ncbi:hypothetical protein IFR05_017392 [Cadophora sp. M221]|nr:hypothetical protein IFR05_017392 [Cadophora sp. M221]
MQYSHLAIGLAGLSTAIAFPAKVHSRSPLVGVQAVAQAVAGPNLEGLSHEPSNLPVDAQAVLDQYQTYADHASSAIGPKQSDMFCSAGWCYQESPCFSVDRVAIVDIPSTTGQAVAPLTIPQFTALLDSILATPNTTFDDTNHDTVFSGLKTTIGDATLEVIAPKSTIDSAFLAGMIFDTYKASANSGGNAVRAVQAQQDGGPAPSIAICLYPQAADGASSRNFCLGKELNGSRPSVPTKRALNARFSLVGMFAGFCSFLDIPLLCPDED